MLASRMAVARSRATGRQFNDAMAREPGHASWKNPARANDGELEGAAYWKFNRIRRSGDDGDAMQCEGTTWASSRQESVGLDGRETG